MDQLRRFRIIYRDESPGAPRQSLTLRAYDEENAVERFEDAPDGEGWEILEVRDVGAALPLPLKGFEGAHAKAAAKAREGRGIEGRIGWEFAVYLGAVSLLLFAALLQLDARERVRACTTDTDCMEAERLLLIGLDTWPLCSDCTLDYAGEGR